MELSTSHPSPEVLQDFCERWGVRELALFGSAARGEQTPDSDIDLLISFEAGRRVSLLDLAEMEMELERLYGREVELVSRRAVETSENEIRRRNVLEAAQPIVQRSTRE
jgi:predicted nucleotidyltransferase